jgi:hypothetical protein
MPDDKTIAMILAICNLMGNTRNRVADAVVAYEEAMREICDYRQSHGLQEVGGYEGPERER